MIESAKLNDGGTIPLVGYGTYPLTGPEAARAMDAALEAGYRHFDTAQMYGNERDVGRMLGESGLARDELFVTTKVHPDNYAPGKFADTVAGSLADLKLDYVDMLLLHWPNPQFDMQRTLEMLMAAQDAGQARHIGVSNFEPPDLARAMKMTNGRVTNDQVEFHPLLDQSALQEAAAGHGVVITAYCPVARGELVGNEVLAGIGARYGKTEVQVALRWMVQQGVVTIPMSRTPERIKANIDIFDFTLSDQEMAAVGALRANNRRIVQVAGLSPTWGLD